MRTLLLIATIGALGGCKERPAPGTERAAIARLVVAEAQRRYTGSGNQDTVVLFVDPGDLSEAAARYHFEWCSDPIDPSRFAPPPPPPHLVDPDGGFSGAGVRVRRDGAVETVSRPAAESQRPISVYLAGRRGSRILIAWDREEDGGFLEAETSRGELTIIAACHEWEA